MRILAALMPLFLSASLAADDFQDAKWIGDAGLLGRLFALRLDVARAQGVV